MKLKINYENNNDFEINNNFEKNKTRISPLKKENNNDLNKQMEENLNHFISIKLQNYFYNPKARHYKKLF